MFLLINLAERDKIKLALFDDKDFFSFEYDGRNRELLFVIDAFLKERKIDKKEIKGVMVVVGAGSFTNTRISAVTANTFAYVLQIPLLAITVEQAKDPQKFISELLKQPAGQYISATYSAPPNIG